LPRWPDAVMVAAAQLQQPAGQGTRRRRGIESAEAVAVEVIVLPVKDTMPPSLGVLRSPTGPDVQTNALAGNRAAGPGRNQRVTARSLWR